MKKHFIILVFIIFTSLFAKEKIIDNLEKSLKDLTGMKRVEVLIEIADSTKSTNPQKAIELSEEALTIAIKDKSKIREQAEIYRILTIASENSYLVEESKKNALKALELYQELNDKQNLALLNFKLGSIQRELGNYDESILYFEKSLDLHTEFGSKEDICYDNYFLGASYLFKNNYKKSLAYELKAWEIIKNDSNPDTELKSGILNLIGRSYELNNEYQKAQEYFHKSLGILDKEKKASNYANTLHNIAMLYDKMGESKKAIHDLKEALLLLKKVNNKAGIAYTYQNLGIVYFNANNLTDAIQSFQKALPLFEKMQAQFGLATVHNYLARSYFKLDDISKAEFNIKKTYQIATKIKMNGLLKEAFELMSQIDFKKRNYKNAYLNLKKYEAIYDSIHSYEQNKLITEMQTKYETAKKEEENTKLEQKNKLSKLIISRQKSLNNLLIIITLVILISAVLFWGQYRQKKLAFEKLEEADKIIREQNKELDLMNKTRNRFFSIISHDLKNSFSSIKMGTELLSDINKLQQDEIAIIADEIKSYVDNLYNLLENLLEWARLQIGKTHHNPEKFNLADLISDVLIFFEKKAEIKNIELSHNLTECSIKADKNMIYSVFQNLISNALKFTESGGKIIIEQKMNNENIEIIVTDNGVGINKELIENIFHVDKVISRRGTHNEKGTGLGLVLCKEFIEKNNGEIWIESKEEKGTSVHIILEVIEG